LPLAEGSRVAPRGRLGTLRDGAQLLRGEVLAGTDEVDAFVKASTCRRRREVVRAWAVRPS
jgi:hypothetical protein